MHSVASRVPPVLGWWSRIVTSGLVGRHAARAAEHLVLEPHRHKKKPSHLLLIDRVRLVRVHQLENLQRSSRMSSTRLAMNMDEHIPGVILPRVRETAFYFYRATKGPPSSDLELAQHRAVALSTCSKTQSGATSRPRTSKPLQADRQVALCFVRK